MLRGRVGLKVKKIFCCALIFLGMPFLGNAQKCDKEVWGHVYKPQRFIKIRECAVVTGKVRHIRKEDDGDWHIELRLDRPYRWMLNARNRQAQAKSLVIEPICVGEVKQDDAVDSCKGFSQTFLALKVGAHVRVVGPLVTDTEANHGWNEIHAPTSVALIE